MIINIDAATYTGRIQIGKQGENLTTDVVFDCNAWLSELDGGTLSIVHQRNSDPDAYPCGNYTTDGKVLTWNVNETDLAYCGLGACELRYTIGERIAKTKTFVTQTMKALDPGETPPEAWEPYIDRVIDAATHEMENMTVSASATQGEETSASVTKTRIDDHENLDFYFVVEKGDKGDPGQDGQDGKSIVNATASIDANVGTPSVTVTTSSSDAGLTVYLAFHNMKGIPGASFDTSYLPSDTANGSPATFPDGAKNVPVDELVTAIVPQQDLHGYSKPWPAGGNVNLWDEQIALGYFSVIGAWVNDNVVASKNPIPVTPGAQYYVKLFGGTTNIYITEWTEPVPSGVSDTEHFINRVTIAGGYGWITIPNNCNAIHLNVGAAYGSIYNNNIVIATSVPASYSPGANICPITGFTQAEITHNGDTDTIPFGQTVYGGELNVTTGVLTITYGIVDNLGSLSWSYNSMQDFYYAVISDMYKSARSTDPSVDAISDIFSYKGNAGWGDMANGTFGINGSQRQLRVHYDVPDFSTAVTGHQFAYKLEESVTVQLTPDEVRTVLGSNSISSNCGAVSVRYRADIGLYIDKKLS